MDTHITDRPVIHLGEAGETVFQPAHEPAPEDHAEKSHPRSDIQTCDAEATVLPSAHELSLDVHAGQSPARPEVQTGGAEEIVSPSANEPASYVHPKQSQPRSEIQANGADETVFPSAHEPASEDHPARSDKPAETKPVDVKPDLAPRPRRNGLMMAGCAAAVLIVAGGVFWVSPYNHLAFTNASRQVVAANDVRLNTGIMAAPVAPAAKLARAPLPSHELAPVPASQGSSGDDMANFLRLGGQDPTDGGRAVAVAAAPATAPITVRPKPQPVVAAEPVRVPAPAVVPKPADAVAAVALLRPSPMTDAQQVQVLDLVTQLGTLVRDQRAEIAQLRTDEQSLAQRVDSSLADFTRRMSLREANAALRAAKGEEAGVFQTRPATLGVTPVAARIIAPVAFPQDAGSHRYHVQAASPGMAMLSELDPSGGEEQQLPVSPGDDVPGWGKVTSISQRGTSWVVKTSHGLIQ